MPTEPEPTLGKADAFVDNSEVSRLSIESIGQHTHLRLAHVYLQMAHQEPAAPPSKLVVVALPPLDEGPHLSYAIQWAIFTTIATVGYVLILRKAARQPYHSTDDEPEHS